LGCAGSEEVVRWGGRTILLQPETSGQLKRCASLMSMRVAFALMPSLFCTNATYYICICQGQA